VSFFVKFLLGIMALTFFLLFVLIISYKEMRPLAVQGDVKAQYFLSIMYKMGDVVTQDYKQSVYWTTKAAEQGHVKAQYNLGHMYVDGDGTPQDYVMAHMLFNIAAANGNEDAKTNRDRVEDMMTSNQIEQAQQLAKEWIEKY